MEEVAAAVRKAWTSAEFRTGERDYAPGYAAMLAGEEAFVPDSAAFDALRGFADELAGVLQFDSGEAR